MKTDFQSDNRSLVSPEFAAQAVKRFWERLRAGEEAVDILGCRDPYYVGKIVLGDLNTSMSYEVCSCIMRWNEEDSDCI